MDILNSSNLLFLGTLFKMDSINNNYMILLIILYVSVSFIFESIDKDNIKTLIDKNTKIIINYIIPNNSVSIELKTHSVTYSIGYSDKVQKKKIYSTEFIALLDYLKDINITKKKEILTTQLKDTCYFNRQNEDTDDRYQFIPCADFYEDTLISKEHNIYLKMYSIKNIDDSDDKKECSTDLTATLYSYYSDNDEKLKKINVLKNFLNKIKESYQSKIMKKDNNKYIYVYQKLENIDEENRLIYSEHINIHNKTFDNIFIENKQKLHNYVKKFNSEVDENTLIDFKKMGMPYKAGMLFWGSPGTGKTSTIKAILKETNRHGVIINLSNIESNKELESIFRNQKINGKTYKGNELCFILEDCDATKLSSLKERNDDKLISVTKKDDTENNKDISVELKNLLTTQQKGFDLSCFLNILDGIIELYGIMIILTTNHPEKIDEALIRPGRIDFKYEFKKCTKKIIIDMIKLKFNLSTNQINEHKLINKFKDYILSPAEIQCILFEFDNAELCIKHIIKQIELKSNI